LSSGRDVDLGPLVRVVTNGVTKVIDSVAAGVSRGNNENIIRASSRVPGESRGLALGERGGVDCEVSSDPKGGKSEKEGGGEKSGVHRRNNFSREGSREGEGRTSPSA